jgi:6-phosphofructokinase 1
MIIRIFTKKVKPRKSSSIVVIAEGDKIGKNVFELKDYVEAIYLNMMLEFLFYHMQRGGSPFVLIGF